MEGVHDNFGEASCISFGNRVLAALPREEYERLSPHLEMIKIPTGKIVYHVGEHMRYAYFPKRGMFSLLSTTGDGRTIEVGTIGSEGMTGTPLILRGDTTPYQVVVQLAINAVRIKGSVLREEFKRGGRLQDLLLRCANAHINQIVKSAACNRFHTVEERLCRWLLVCRDCVQTDTIHLTQECLSHMLGVPRSSVTAAAGALQDRRLIRYNRGEITLLERPRLEAASCECYRLVREDFRDFQVA
jgi:CRP-like cAMP-binding protein